ncbi:MAG: helix-turn-helix domain-containing protein, partial [Bacteroidota bacterium]
INISDHFFLSRLPAQQNRPDRVQYAVNSLIQNPSQKIYHLAKSLNISERQFSREYKRKIGINPSQHRRLIKFLRASTILNTGQYYSFGQLAEQLGYSDPSHLVKDFRFFTNHPPTAYLNKSLNFAKKTAWRENYLE